MLGFDFVFEVFEDFLDLGKGDGLDVAVAGVFAGKVLVIGLGEVEALEGFDGGDDGAGEGLGVVELLDVGLGDAFLVVVFVEDGAAVLGAAVGALAVEGGGVVAGEEDAEELAVGDFRGVVGDADGFGVTGVAVADALVVGGVGGAAGVTGDDVLDALEGFEDGLSAPEAAAGNDHCLFGVVLGCGEIDGGFGEVGGGLGGEGAGDAGEGRESHEEHSCEGGFHTADYMGVARGCLVG